MRARSVTLSALFAALTIVLVGLGFAGPSRAPTLRGLAHRVALLEAQAACTRLVAPVSQFGQDGDALIGTGYLYIDNTDPIRTQIYTTSALDFDSNSATPTMYVVTVSPRCVKGSHAMFRSGEPGSREPLKSRRGHP